MKTLGQFLIQYLVTMASERERERERKRETKGIDREK